MQVKVDSSKCIGCGLCANSCPEVFELNSEGIAGVKENVDFSAVSCDVKEIASQCPVGAIEVSD